MATRTLNQWLNRAEVGYIFWREATREQHIEMGEFLSLGREPGSHVLLTDDAVSARHARIEKRPAGYFLRDLRSRNGTFLNGVRVVEAYLKDGDRLRVGQTDLTFSWERDLTPMRKSLSSQNAKWNEQLARIPGIAQTELPVLLNGPSGTGKEILAQMIHRLSPRSEGPFVSVNCGALTDSLVESELFGHLKGSFTGATSDRKGAFEAARGGTLFLDEIGDLPISLQPKLLRALENCQIRPVGSDRTVLTDVRVIAATHHNLLHKIHQGEFREDLYFRLNVVQMRTPRLRERPEDFEDLVNQFAKVHRVRFSFAAVQQLKEHNWPGNIRELKNIVARAKAFFGEEEVTQENVNELLMTPASQAPVPVEKDRGLMREVEKELIRARLIANGGNQRRTAHDLGMAKSTLHDRLKRYNLRSENFRA